MPGPSFSICLEISFSKPKDKEIQPFSYLEARAWRQMWICRDAEGYPRVSASPEIPLPKGFFVPGSCPCREDASCTPASFSSCTPWSGNQHFPLVAVQPRVPAAATHTSRSLGLWRAEEEE